ncbi:beta-lactamase/transpeptidase-like protein [Cadophora sp. DSE1049]|nr:beta-lactamase/transpeptidase-like protein [Cadophora sp. DSE1049]
MSNFEVTLEKAIKDHDVPGAVLVAADKKGAFQYAKAFGPRSLKEGSSDPMPLDAVMWLASCTKFMTTICAMQCVERGDFTLDEDVTRLLPELKGLEILKGFDDQQQPILEKNNKSITLRHLLTHSSGLTYDVFNPEVSRWRAQRGETPQLGGKRKLTDAYLCPLLFAPGEGWEYSGSIDWAGQMVERANNMDLHAYMEKHIWNPLGIKDFTFRIKERPDLKAKMPDMSMREAGLTIFGTTDNPEAKVVYTAESVWDPDTPDCHGGAGVYGSPIGYHKILHSILSDDGKLLKSETVDEMFKPQLTDASLTMLMQKLSIKELRDIMGGFPAGTKVDLGIGGMINLEDLASGRKSGSMTWGGLPNLIWWIDRKGGLASIYGSQVIPPGDPKTFELERLWETELYSKLGSEASVV